MSEDATEVEVRIDLEEPDVIGTFTCSRCDEEIDGAPKMEFTPKFWNWDPDVVFELCEDCTDSMEEWWYGN